MRFRLLVSLLVLITLAPLARADYVKTFDVTIKVNKDASLDVTENVTVVFETPRHGIYRFIPVKYDRGGNAWTVDFRLDSITDENGHKLHFSQSKQGRDVSFRIGDADTTMTGEHTYRLHYLVRRAVQFFGDNDAGRGDNPQVYWNVTGDQWPYPIQSATATLIPPDGVDPKQVRTRSFVGAYRSTDEGAATADAAGVHFSAGRELPAGTGFTIVAGLPKGSVEKPTFAQELWWFIKDWWPVAIFPGIAIAAMTTLWMRSGRDVGAGKQAVGVEFSPPKDLSPTEVGTLIDESCDTPDIVATLIDLAARGWLTIKEVPAERILFLSSKDYQFIRNHNPPNDKLKRHEETFLTGLFGGHAHMTTLSAQKNTFYPHVSAIRKSIYQSMADNGLFTANPESVRGGWYALGILLLIGGVALCFFISNMISFGIGFILAGVVVLAGGRAMPARTALGTRKLIECLSFKRFVEMVEKDRIKQMAMTDPTVFGRLLPYAMVLGVADQWAEAFAGLMTQPPDWYVGPPGQPFNSRYFITDLGSGMRTMQRTLTSQPQSSGASSGSSGFSSGGGFSGGGFGGGGGGSW